MNSLPSPPSSFERAPPGRPRNTCTPLALRVSDKGIRSGYRQQNSTNSVLDTSSESAASRSSSGSSSTGFGPSSYHPPATSEPAASQHLAATQPSSHTASVERISSPSARASEVVKGIVKHAQSGWPVTTAPFRAVSLDAFHQVCEILSHEHGWIWDKLRYNYDPKKAELGLHMPDTVHDFPSSGFHDLIVIKIRDLVESLQVSTARDLSHLLVKLFGGSPQIRLRGGAERYPDGCVRYPQTHPPTMTIETSHSQKDKMLPLIAEEYYHGSDHLIRCILTIHIEHWDAQQRYKKEDVRQAARGNNKAELERLDKELEGTLSRKQRKAKEERKKELEAESEPQRRQCNYNLYTENATQDGLESKFDDDKPFYPAFDASDTIDIKLGDLFPRHILPASDPVAAYTISITMPEMFSILADAEAEQIALDTVARQIKAQDRMEAQEEETTTESNNKRTASPILSRRAKKVLKEMEDEARIEEEGGEDQSESLSPKSDKEHPRPPVTGHTPKKAHATRWKSAPSS